ncbi:MAG TPA: site-specific integrase [Candidatus Acidoferrales bacterium]|nr:site-specific integrase [Candidatus Acidoferrales bacterium]
MKAEATASSTKNSPVSRQQSHVANFSKVLDGRKQPIRGLWVRNGRYYAQLKVENPITGLKKTRRVPLNDSEGDPVQTAAQAIAELKRLHTQRADNQLPVLGRTPKLADYVLHYLDFVSSGQGTKKPGTIQKEKAILARWTDVLGQLRIDQIKRVHVNRFIESRLKEEVSPRTINLDVIALRVVLKRALEDGLIQRLPTEGLRPLKTNTRKRPLFTSDDLEKLCEAAHGEREGKNESMVPVTENAQQFTDYIKFMAFSGTRRSEALGIRWQDVDFGQGQLTVGAEGDTKNRSARVVDFNPKLKAHLLAMKKRRAPDSQWLFPSPQRGEKDIPAKTFKESLLMARAQAKMPNFTFHDCRHHFISMCVMSGVDFMTIAAWVGHRDGGVLIGKVYGHLANEHRKAMAERVNLGPVALDNAASA